MEISNYFSIYLVNSIPLNQGCGSGSGSGSGRIQRFGRIRIRIRIQNFKCILDPFWIRVANIKTSNNKFERWETPSRWVSQYGSLKFLNSWEVGGGVTKGESFYLTRYLRPSAPPPLLLWQLDLGSETVRGETRREYTVIHFCIPNYHSYLSIISY